MQHVRLAVVVVAMAMVVSAQDIRPVHARAKALKAGGFGTIHRYLGTPPPDMETSVRQYRDWVSEPVDTGLKNSMMGVGDYRWTSQVCQDQTVGERIFGNRTGLYFVDLAANHAVHLSNTYGLERHLDWSGLCIEANPMYEVGLMQRRCEFFQGAVGPVDGDVMSFDMRHVFGKLVDEGSRTKHGSKPGKNLAKVVTVSLRTLLRAFNVPKTFHYLSLDIEGAEWFVMQAFPWEEYIFLTASVERPEPIFVAELERQGYVKLLEHGTFGDTFFIHKSLPNYDDIVAAYSGQRIDGSACHL